MTFLVLKSEGTNRPELRFSVLLAEDSTVRLQLVSFRGKET